MKDIVTYSLNADQINSDNYYKDIAEFAEEVILNGRSIIDSIIIDLKNYISLKDMETLRSDEEYLLEILTLGTLWKLYSDDAAELSELPKNIMKKLVDFRKHGGKVKGGADFIRGILATVFLFPNNNYKSNIKPSLKTFEKFLKWLSASGEFEEEVQRFDILKKYFFALSEEKLEQTFFNINSYALWFNIRSENLIGKYTVNVETFLKDEYPKHKFKEDVILCGRQRIEYHLNMTGAEIMNRSFRTDFLKTKIKKLLLPVCMRYNNEKNCKAQYTEDGYTCKDCIENCKVNKLSKMGKKYGFEVLIIPHGSSAFKEKKISYGEIGIVGVACVLNLMSGGWKARRFNLVPQCVILDYCGCKKHWSNKGIVTDININQLKQVLNSGGDSFTSSEF
ncbi:DUF116 domain-containing protein [Clostridium pasteurianum]|uniref:DUF116 domain-containing protein n=1 Tax=Clostridium pasteurianum TaxID=1501 RepID=UPI002260E588|nr:DUF116 domain-containing protein [Clostridium pasteurianum]UZW15654.1 DUF116 domain-containing protein [Clostridium pasteurianum]